MSHDLHLHPPQCYQHQSAALLTQHGKELILGPLLLAELGCSVTHVTGFDTDQLGTFTRDQARPGSQLDAARRKAEIGMDLSGLPLGLASEGAFVPDPHVGILPWDVEIVNAAWKSSAWHRARRTTTSKCLKIGPACSNSQRRPTFQITAWCCARMGQTIHISSKTYTIGRRWKPRFTACTTYRHKGRCLQKAIYAPTATPPAKT
jgi:hypothetical protein